MRAWETDISPHPFVFSPMAFLSRLSHLPRRKARETRRLVYLHRQTRDMCRCRGLREHARTHACWMQAGGGTSPDPPPPSSFHVAGRAPGRQRAGFPLVTSHHGEEYDGRRTSLACRVHVHACFRDGQGDKEGGVGGWRIGRGGARAEGEGEVPPGVTLQDAPNRDA